MIGYCNKGLDLLGEMNSEWPRVGAAPSTQVFLILKRDGCPVGHKGTIQRHENDLYKGFQVNTGFQD